MRGRQPPLVAALLLALAACSGRSLQQLPDEALKDLPVEGRRWVFDAENAVVAALDSVDVAREQAAEAAEQLAGAQRSLKAARAQQPRRGTELGVQAAKAHESLLEMRLQVARERVQLARLRVRKARADLELDKARLVVTYDLAAVRGFSPKVYEAQAGTQAQAFTEQQRRVDALFKKAQALEEEARGARARYIAHSGDHDSGVWLD